MTPESNDDTVRSDHPCPDVIHQQVHVFTVAGLPFASDESLGQCMTKQNFCIGHLPIHRAPGGECLDRPRKNGGRVGIECLTELVNGQPWPTSQSVSLTTEPGPFSREHLRRQSFEVPGGVVGNHPSIR